MTNILRGLFILLQAITFSVLGQTLPDRIRIFSNTYVVLLPISVTLSTNGDTLYGKNQQH